jgi:uncharacterized protein YodC (DUF2158 family)
MAYQFKPGDIVQLKSGGPIMTVSAVGTDFSARMKVWCQWFDGPTKKESGFEPATLKSAGD